MQITLPRFFSTTSSWTSQPMRAWRHRVHCGPFEKRDDALLPLCRGNVSLCLLCSTFLVFPLSPYFFFFFLGPTLLLLLLLLSAVSASSITRPFRTISPHRVFASGRGATKRWEGLVLGQLRLSTWRRRPAGDWSRWAGSCAFWWVPWPILQQSPFG